jgi:hypothetical protein
MTLPELAAVAGRGHARLDRRGLAALMQRFPDKEHDNG